MQCLCQERNKCPSLKSSLPLICTFLPYPLPPPHPPAVTKVNGAKPELFTTSYIVGLEGKRMNHRTMFPALKNNAAAGYKGSVKIELLKGVGQLK